MKGDELQKVTPDVIGKAEAVIDAVIEAWVPKEVMTTYALGAKVRAVFASRQQLTWYTDTFSGNGWTALVGSRLLELGYKQTKGGYGWHK